MRFLHFIAAIAFTSAVFGSEFSYESNQKVALSDLIAVGEIIDIDFGPIQLLEGYPTRRQAVAIRFKIERVLFGDASPEITIQGESTYFKTRTEIHGSSAGFSSYGLEKNGKFLAYLKSNKDVFRLASDSNQFFEDIDETHNLIRANWQTSKHIDLQGKLQEITALAKQKKMTQQGN